MTKPFTMAEQKRSTLFKNYEKIAIIFAATHFDACCKYNEETGELKQMYADIPQSEKDASDFAVFLN